MFFIVTNLKLWVQAHECKYDRKILNICSGAWTEVTIFA